MSTWYAARTSRGRARPLVPVTRMAKSTHARTAVTRLRSAGLPRSRRFVRMFRISVVLALLAASGVWGASCSHQQTPPPDAASGGGGGGGSGSGGSSGGGGANGSCHVNSDCAAGQVCYAGLATTCAGLMLGTCVPRLSTQCSQTTGAGCRCLTLPSNTMCSAGGAYCAGSDDPASCWTCKLPQ